MKKNIYLLIIIITTFSVNITPSYAAIPVIDPAAIAKMVANFIADNKVQLQILAKDAKIEIESTATQINTFKTMWDGTVSRPLKDAMTLISIAKNADQILNLV
ncbi:hypothetical protein K9M47_04345, partial [Candidatus Gracilibacteria bacterium]|nr:hypothetical protein [Candidatus Gracilibacteria bacterium]